MFYKKENFPEEGEVVSCTVKKILYNSIFAELDEYINKEGMIHISEIAPGRIRNIRDYVKEGKKIICKVLRVNKEKGHIDLSLRRVSLSMRKNKITEYKQEQKAEKILETLAKELKTNLENIYKKIGYKIIEKYGLLNPCFQEVVIKNESILADLKSDERLTKLLVKIVKEKIKPPSVKISASLILKSNAPNGIEIIKQSLKKATDFAAERKYQLKFSYTGAPKYKITVIATDYKTAEKAIEETANLAISTIKENGGTGEFLRNV